MNIRCGFIEREDCLARSQHGPLPQAAKQGEQLLMLSYLLGVSY